MAWWRHTVGMTAILIKLGLIRPVHAQNAEDRRRLAAVAAQERQVLRQVAWATAIGLAVAAAGWTAAALGWVVALMELMGLR